MKKINRRSWLAGSAAVAGIPFLGATASGCDDIPTRKALPEGGVIITARLTAQAGEEAAVEAACKAMVAPTRKEDGCITYILQVNEKQKGDCLFYEQWESKAALDAHSATEHMKQFSKEIAGKLADGDVVYWKLPE